MFGQEDEYKNENPLSNQQFKSKNLRKIKMTLHKYFNLVDFLS